MRNKTILILFLSFIFLNYNCWAQSANVEKPPEDVKSNAEADDSMSKLEDLKALDYPELQVVPRASERLVMETVAARSQNALMLFPYVASSTMTLVSGVAVNTHLKPDFSNSENNDVQLATKFAMGVGAAGLGLVYWFSANDMYGATLAQIRSLKNKDRRTELLKERLAEEAFEKTAQMARQWKWIFAATNFVASARLIDKSTGDNNIFPSLSLVTSLLPLFITTNYEVNYLKQQEYKRRIYVPLTWFDYHYNPIQVSWQPRLNAIWTF